MKKVYGATMGTPGSVVKILERAAKANAYQKAAAGIAGAGTVSLALSGFQAVSCSWKCAKK